MTLVRPGVMKKILVWVLSPIALLVFLYTAFGVYSLHTGCWIRSEDEAIQFSRTQIRQQAKFIARFLEEPASDIEASKAVLFSRFDDRYGDFGMTYQTPRGQLVDMEISTSCGVHLSFPPTIGPRLDAIFTRDLRTGQRYLEISRATGVLSVPGTAANGVRPYYPPTIGPRLDAIFAGDLRTDQPYLELSTATGVLSVPGTAANVDTAQSRGERIRR